MKKLLFAILASFMGSLSPSFGQVASDSLKFSDLILPIEGQKLVSDAWGCENVGPRYVDNGLEAPDMSVWGAYVLKADDGLYHMFACTWDEALGYRAFKTKSSIVHATSDKISGPYVKKEVLGYGFDPEVIVMDDGTYVVKVWEGRYVSKSLNGPWTFQHMSYNLRGRLLYKGNSLNTLANMTYTKRPDGSYVSVDRGGGVWVSRDSLLEWTMASDLPVFSMDKGYITDPVIWHDNVQYYMVEKNYVTGNCSFYRSPDALHWKYEEMFATPAKLIRHADGTVENWREVNRFKMVTDSYGRVENVVLCASDILFGADSKKDNHNCKAFVIPFVKSRLMELASPEAISSQTTSVDIIIKGEDDFRPAKELDLNSLRLGAHRVVAAHQGLKAVKLKKKGKNDVVVSFAGNAGDLGIDAEEWALRVVGKTKTGKIVHGYAAMPGFSMANSHIMSSMMPTVDANDVPNSVEVCNLGVVTSPVINVQVCTPDNVVLATGVIEPLAPFASCVVSLKGEKNIPTGTKALNVKFFDDKRLSNVSYIPTRNINSFQERLVALVDSARVLSEKDKYTEGKMELQMAMMDGLGNISRFDIGELQVAYASLEEAITEFYKVNGVDLEFYDFYSWARNSGARINLAQSAIKISDGKGMVDVTPIESLSDGKSVCRVDGRIAAICGSRHLGLRDNGEGDRFTGLFDYMRTAFFSIRDLTPGTVISISGVDLFLLNGQNLCAASDPDKADVQSNARIESGKVYVVKGEPGQKINLDFRTEHYSCVYNITIEKPVAQPEPPKAAPKAKRSAKKK